MDRSQGRLRLLLLGLMVLLPGACRPAREPAPVAQRLLEDPCILVSRAEVEALLGPLASNPFRATTREAPDPAGPTCLYRASNGQSVTLTPAYAGGALALRALGDTMVPAPGAVRSFWLPPGRLVALIDDALLDLDVSNTTVGPRGAVRLARAAMPRLTTPLPYDGSAAARHALPWRIASRDPCGMLDPGAVEAAVGPLSGPVQRIDSTGCRYPRPRRGLTGQDVELRFVWGNGVAWLHASQSGQDEATPRALTPGIIERLERDTMVRELLGAAGLDTTQFHELTEGHAPALGGPWEVAAAAPGEFRFARNGVGVTVIAPTREIARRLAERVASRL
jgi:hypothetical protein